MATFTADVTYHEFPVRNSFDGPLKDSYEEAKSASLCGNNHVTLVAYRNGEDAGAVEFLDGKAFTSLSHEAQRVVDGD